MVDNVGGDLVHFHQLLGEPHFHSCVKMSSQLQNAWVVTFLEFAVPENADSVGGRKNFKTAAIVWEDKLWENNWVVVAGKEAQAESFQQNLLNKSVCREETFLQIFLFNHVE